MQVSVHENAAANHSLTLLDKFAVALVPPERGPEWSLRVGPVVLAHNPANVLRSLAGVVERNGGYQVVAHVCTNDVMEEMGINEAKVTINCCSSTTGESPGAAVIVRHGRVGVLEEGNGNFKNKSVKSMGQSKTSKDFGRRNIPIQLFTHSHGMPQRTITLRLPKS